MSPLSSWCWLQSFALTPALCVCVHACVCEMVSPYSFSLISMFFFLVELLRISSGGCISEASSAMMSWSSCSVRVVRGGKWRGGEGRTGEGRGGERGAEQCTCLKFEDKGLVYLQASGDSYIAGVRLVERREEGREGGREGGRVEGGTPGLPGVCLPSGFWLTDLWKGLVHYVPMRSVWVCA